MMRRLPRDCCCLVSCVAMLAAASPVLFPAPSHELNDFQSTYLDDDDDDGDYEKSLALRRYDDGARKAFAIEYSTLEPEAEMLPQHYTGLKPPGVDHMEMRTDVIDDFADSRGPARKSRDRENRRRDQQVAPGDIGRSRDARFSGGTRREMKSERYTNAGSRFQPRDTKSAGFVRDEKEATERVRGATAPRRPDFESSFET